MAYDQRISVVIRTERYGLSKGRQNVSTKLGGHVSTSKLSQFDDTHEIPVSYTHLTLPTILLV